MPEEQKPQNPAPLALAPELGGLQKYSDEDFASVAKAGDFLPRIQLLTAASEPVKKGEFSANHYALIDGSVLKDLGSNVDCMAISFRPKALRIGEVVMARYNPKDEEFQRIQEESDEANSGCMFGPEFLIWIPATQQFACFFMGTKSARRESPALMAILKKWREGKIPNPTVTLKSQFIETSKYSWQAPKVVECSTPMQPPDIEEAKKQIAKFQNPKESEVETIDEGTTGERVR